jgi:single-strand DNA-binding protein
MACRAGHCGFRHAGAGVISAPSEPWGGAAAAAAECRKCRTAAGSGGVSSLNRAMLIGNVGQAPEIRSTQTGQRIANFSLATNERWKDKHSGEQRERTEWHRIVVFNEHLVGVIERFVDKGSQLFVEGKLQTRKWTDNAGVERYSTEIVLQNYDGDIRLLGSPNGSGGRPPPAEPDSYGSRPYSARHDAPSTLGGVARGGADLDDEIPF